MPNVGGLVGLPDVAVCGDVALPGLAALGSTSYGAPTQGTFIVEHLVTRGARVAGQEEVDLTQDNHLAFA